MQDLPSNKGPWVHRVLTIIFVAVFALLWFWLLGFVVDDIGAWPGPSYAELEGRRLDRNLVSEAAALQRQIADTERRIIDQKARQELLRDSTGNSQTTMNQLLEFQRSSLAKNVTPSDEERKALAESQQRFLTNQNQYQILNQQLVQLNEQLRNLKDKQQQSDDTLNRQRAPIRAEFERLQRTHDLRIAGLKLAVLIPLLVVGVILFRKHRTGPYAPIVYAFGGAILLKVGLVMHQYFPSRYFKYVLIVTAIAIVLQALLYLIRMVAFPKRDWLLKQYREAYEAFLCPICAYPIRRGPLKYMVWTRRTIKKMPPPQAGPNDVEEPYICPMCSTRLYGECENCHAVRPSLLPSCQRCGRLMTPSTG
jgi:hypothetical protein